MNDIPEWFGNFCDSLQSYSSDKINQALLPHRGIYVVESGQRAYIDFETESDFTVLLLKWS
jgi:hypothetical protein